MRTHPRFARIWCVVAIVITLAACHVARAGSNASVNGVGTGTAWAGVGAHTSGTTNFVISVTLPSPSAAMPPNNYKTNAPAPKGASTGTYARVIVQPGGIITHYNHPSNSDGTDNPELQSQVNITPAACSTITFTSQIDQTQQEFNDNGNNGTITVTGTGTGGTAMWLRGYEYTGDITNLPPPDPSSVTNPITQFLQTNGILRFNCLLVGPFSYGSNNCPLVIPFTMISSNLANLIIISDSAALSTPLTIQCPPDVTVQCSNAIYYPAVGYSGCSVTLSYYPPLPSAGYFPAGSFPIGITPVTVTATDGDGNTTNCTFHVSVVGTLPVPPPLPTLTGQLSVQVPTPYATQICGLQTNPIEGTTTNPTTYNTQGTFTVYWTFDDGHGDIVKTNQTVIVHSTTPPTPPVIPDAVGECSVTVSNAPVATDVAFGNVTGTTTNRLTYTTQGTNFITWTFTDANGNTSTAIQRVIVHDDIPPVKPVLPDLTLTCSSSLTPPAPTTTDNCAGVVTGTTTTPFPLTTLGTNVVTWTFSDGHGNSSTANQNIIVTGVTFVGFYSPISGSNGTCSATVRTINTGSDIPIKFDTLCGSTVITGGTPPIVQIQAYKNCTPGTDLVTQPATYQNNWHFNWDTTGWSKGVYKVIVILQDGSTNYVFVTLK